MSKDETEELELLFQLVRGKYGDRLTPSELDDLRKNIGNILENAAALRKVKLSNSDEPFTVFKPYRKR